MLRKIIIVTLIVTIFTLGILFLYPTKGNILNNGLYRLSSSEFIEKLHTDVDIKEYLGNKQSDQVYLVTRQIAQKFDTGIYLEKIEIKDNRFTIVISLKSKWRLLEGICLMTDMPNSGGGSSSIMKRISTFNNNQMVPYTGICVDSNEMIYINYDVNLIKEYDILNIDFSGFNLLTYKLSVLK
jgi:hypothetical protein